MKEASEATKNLSENEGLKKNCLLIRSKDLFSSQSRQLQIEHQGELYTLRITSKDKLILTK